MSPQDVMTLLNEYLTEMAEAIRPWKGYNNNFIGDAIVVIFGAPESRGEIEWAAVGAALDMKRRLESLNVRRGELGEDREGFTVKDQGLHQVKGRGEPVHVYAVYS